jgi:hypothetical protein
LSARISNHLNNEFSMSKPPPWRPASSRPDNSDADEAQRIFDTVTGPNLRASDNLIQAMAICGGGTLCAIIGALWAWQTHSPPLPGILVGGFAGVVISLFLSGAIIGIVRLRSATKRR